MQPGLAFSSSSVPFAVPRWRMFSDDAVFDPGRSAAQLCPNEKAMILHLTTCGLKLEVEKVCLLFAALIGVLGIHQVPKARDSSLVPSYWDSGPLGVWSASRALA